MIFNHHYDTRLLLNDFENEVMMPVSTRWLVRARIQLRHPIDTGYLRSYFQVNGLHLFEFFYLKFVH